MNELTNKKDLISFLEIFTSALRSLCVSNNISIRFTIHYLSFMFLHDPLHTIFFIFPEKSKILRGPNTSPILSFPANFKHYITSASFSPPEHLVLITVKNIK